ncbi:MAG TPA: sugar ABC transporter substrate-binding protein [Mycobacteriales bacterium]|jgi:multiple sugar transport system substrate-binding protein|nr:sugar ABC transporter substrate-binding protein [Mycobacteriales bacterium]
MKLRKTTALLVSAAFALTACSSTEDDNDSAATTTAGQTTSAPAGTSAPATTATTQADPGKSAALRWRTRPDNQAEIDVYKQISEQIDGKNDAFTLAYEPGGTEGAGYQDVLKTELAAGTAPDVFWIPGTDVADFAKRDLILDLRSLAGATGHKDEDFYEGPMEQLKTDPATGQPGDKLWGLPRDVSTFALYINRDLIAQANTDDPLELSKAGKWDWAAFEKTARDISKIGGAVKGFGANSWWANYGYFVNSAGGSFFNEDRTQCKLDDPKSIDGLNFMKKLYDDKLAVPFGEDAEPPFKAGTVGMFMNGRWATPGTRSGVKFNWDVVALPAGPAGSKNWLFWGAYVVNKKTKNPEAAWKLVQELTANETQGEISKLGANIPSRKSDEAIKSFLTFTPPTNNQAFVDGITNEPATEGPLWKGDWPLFSSKADSAVQALMTGKTTMPKFQSSICKTETAEAFKG